MRVALSAVLLLSCLPLQAWQLPAPREMAALRGEAPYSIALEAGVPLPPTPEEARASAGYRYGLERLALKRAMVFRTSCAKAERNRITPENNRATAALARQLGAPELFAQYLELLASDTISRRQTYAVQRALSSLLRYSYGIDALQIRLLSESLELPQKQHTPYMLQMPLGGLYDFVSESDMKREMLMQDMQLITQILRLVHAELLKVHDRASADAAADALQSYILLWSTTSSGRGLLRNGNITLSPAEKLSLQLLESTAASLYSTRRALFEAEWYDSASLRSVDEIFR